MQDINGKVVEVESSALISKRNPAIKQLSWTQGNDLLKTTGKKLSIMPVDSDGFFIGMSRARLEEKIYALGYREKFYVSGVGTPRGLRSDMTCEQKTGYAISNYYNTLSANADTVEFLNVRIGGIKGDSEGTCIYGLSKHPEIVKYEKKTS